MSLEGNLRDLALPEVCQLLAHTRKTGELQLKAPLAGLNAHILFDSGAIVGADVTGIIPSPANDADIAPVDAAQTVERITQELLCWSEGEFRFVPRPADAPAIRTGVRLHTEMLLMEGARRSEEWARLSDRIPNARAVPTFADVEPRQLPLLHLQPRQWEVLTGVDGQRDLPALARTLGRDLLEVAETVHALIGTGLLKLAEVNRVQRAQATPPSSVAQPDNERTDLWVPIETSNVSEADDLHGEDDEIFDPVRVGVITPEGLPRLRTPLHVSRVTGTNTDMFARQPGAQDEGLRERGDAAARRGDLFEAMRCWNAVIEQTEAAGEKAQNDRAHAVEAIAVVQRLQALLQGNERVRHTCL